MMTWGYADTACGASPNAVVFLAGHVRQVEPLRPHCHVTLFQAAPLDQARCAAFEAFGRHVFTSFSVCRQPLKFAGPAHAFRHALFQAALSAVGTAVAALRGAAMFHPKKKPRI